MKCSVSHTLASWRGVYGLVGDGGIESRRVVKVEKAARRLMEGNDVKKVFREV